VLACAFSGACAVSACGYNVAASFAPQILELAFGEYPPMTARQIAKPKITDSKTDKMLHVISNGFEHPANLAIDSLSQDNAQADGRHRVESRNPCSLAVEKNSAQQFRRERGIPRPIHRHLVFLVDFVTWMGEPLGKLALICEKKQAFGLCVQTPDVEQPREFCWQQIENSVTGVRISPGGNESGGLVEHDGERRGDLNKFAINLNVVTRGALRTEIGADLPVDRHATGRNQFIARPARSNAGRGEETIEAHDRDS
jgi:hypothetical protein